MDFIFCLCDIDVVLCIIIHVFRGLCDFISIICNSTPPNMNLLAVALVNFPPVCQGGRTILGTGYSPIRCNVFCPYLNLDSWSNGILYSDIYVDIHTNPLLYYVVTGSDTVYKMYVTGRS